MHAVMSGMSGISFPEVLFDLRRDEIRGWWWCDMRCATVDDVINEQTDGPTADSKDNAGVWETEYEDGDDGGNEWV